MERQQREAQERQSQNARYMHAAAPELAADPQPEEAAPPEPEPVAPFVRETRKVGRNEACPCGSGKKYKQCHGQIS